MDGLKVNILSNLTFELGICQLGQTH